MVEINVQGWTEKPPSLPLVVDALAAVLVVLELEAADLSDPVLLGFVEFVLLCDLEIKSML